MHAVEQEDQTAMEIDINITLFERMIQRQEGLKEEKWEINKRLTELQSRFKNTGEEPEHIIYLTPFIFLGLCLLTRSFKIKRNKDISVQVLPPYFIYPIRGIYI